MRTKLLAAASVAALGLFAFTPAMAQPGVGGYVDAGYTNNQFNHGFPHNDEWTLSGAAAAPLGSSQFTVQGDGSALEQHSSAFGTTRGGQLDLSLIWNHPTMGKLGATIGRVEVPVGGPTSIDGTSYGAFGVLYPNHMWTLGVKGGSVQLGSGLPDSTYYGGEIVAYPTQNIALSLTGDSADKVFPIEDRVDSWGLGGEWQPTASPWSVGLGYSSARFSGISLTDSAWSLRFRWYFGGGSNLVSHHRDGAETWGTRQTGYRSLF